MLLKFKGHQTIEEYVKILFFSKSKGFIYKSYVKILHPGLCDCFHQLGPLAAQQENGGHI